MRSIAAHRTLLTAAAALLLAAGTLGTSRAGIHVEAVYDSEPVDVRVWLDRGYDDYYGDIDEIGTYYDVYPSADDVVLYVRAARSCYTTVYVIDTEGFIHVVHPFSPYDDSFLVGGRVYRIWLRDYGFHGGYFGRGVAFAFAVSSPFPFTYASYGRAVFGPHVGFQIYGDPFVAARLFYLSILPPACHRGFVAVSYARFYVREYVRYPGYLCLGWCEPQGPCAHYSSGCGAYRQYRIHAKDPYRVLRPSSDPDREVVRYTRIAPSKDVSDVRVSKTVSGRAAKDAPDVRVSKTLQSPAVKNAADVRVSNGLKTQAPGTRVLKSTAERTRTEVRAPGQTTGERRGVVEKAGATRSVVRSTKESYVTSKRNYEKMREIYDSAGSGDRVQARPAVGAGQLKSSRVAPRAGKEARETVALGNASSSKDNAKSGKSRKGAK